MKPAILQKSCSIQVRSLDKELHLAQLTCRVSSHWDLGSPFKACKPPFSHSFTVCGDFQNPKSSCAILETAIGDRAQRTAFSVCSG